MPLTSLCKRQWKSNRTSAGYRDRIRCDRHVGRRFVQYGFWSGTASTRLRGQSLIKIARNVARQATGSLLLAAPRLALRWAFAVSVSLLCSAAYGDDNAVEPRQGAVGTRTPILVEVRPNARWSLDFVHDQLACGRRFRILNIVDDVTRECLAAEPCPGGRNLNFSGGGRDDGSDRSKGPPLQIILSGLAEIARRICVRQLLQERSILLLDSGLIDYLLLIETHLGRKKMNSCAFNKRVGVCSLGRA